MKCNDPLVNQRGISKNMFWAKGKPRSSSKTHIDYDQARLFKKTRVQILALSAQKDLFFL